MGKKKSSRGRRLKHLIKEAINDGLVYVQEKDKLYYDIHCVPLGDRLYELKFGCDQPLYAKPNHFFVPMIISVHEDGSLGYEFCRNREHALNRSDEIWLQQELEEIIVMHKMGAYTSDCDPTSFSDFNVAYTAHMTRISGR